MTGTAVSIRARSRGVMTLVALTLLVAAVLAGTGHVLAAATAGVLILRRRTRPATSSEG